MTGTLKISGRFDVIWMGASGDLKDLNNGARFRAFTPDPEPQATGRIERRIALTRARSFSRQAKGP